MKDDDIDSQNNNCEKEDENDCDYKDDREKHDDDRDHKHYIEDDDDDIGFDNDKATLSEIYFKHPVILIWINKSANAKEIFSSFSPPYNMHNRVQ